MASPTANDIYELVDRQTYQGQEVLNVYFYYISELFVTTLPTIAQVLAEGWTAQVLPTIAAIQAIGVVHNEIAVRNLYDSADAYSNLISVPGENADDELPIFAALPFQLQGEDHAVRKGAKRIAGMGETGQTNGVLTDAGQIAGAMDVADKMAAAVSVGLIIPDTVFQPCLVKRERSGVSGSYTYALPTVRGTGIKTRIITALLDVLITSQTSRKIGVGA